MLTLRYTLAIFHNRKAEANRLPKHSGTWLRCACLASVFCWYWVLKLTGLHRKHRQRTQSYIQALEDEVLRLRDLELTFKEDVEKLRAELQSKYGNSPKEPYETFTPELTPGMIVIDWEDFYQTTPEAACCIRAAEATELEWTVDKDNALKYQLPPVMWVDAFADTLPLSEAEKKSLAGEGRMEVTRTPLDPETGTKYILQYGP
jgi:hypothetical protein